MKKHELKNMDISVYTETLSNGLEIYLVPYTKVKRYYISYGTNFGSLITDFTPYGSKEECHVPNGVAHFLEHKMFEQASGEDPYDFFGKTGTYVNASTGFEATRYICSGTNNYENNLRYLLNFVNNPYFTDENVEKEKGIIIEEVNMYKDNPESAIDDTCRKCLFNKDHRRIDIGGEKEDIEKITKEDLYLCYENFYQPQNMFVLIVGNIDVNNTMDILKKELEKRENKYEKMPKVKKIEEDYHVHKKEEIVRFNIEVPKLAYMLKLRKKDFSIKDQYELDVYLNTILKCLFGTTSEFYEEGKSNDLYTSFFHSFDTTDDYIVIYLCAESTKQNELLKLIEKTLKNRKNILNEDDFTRSKKVNIANKIKSSCYIDFISDNIFGDLINYNKVIYNKIDIIRNLEYSKLLKVSEELKLDNKSIVVYVPTDDEKYKIEM